MSMYDTRFSLSPEPPDTGLTLPGSVGIASRPPAPELSSPPRRMVGIVDADLLSRLREWRYERSREENVPPYRVLPNALLHEIACVRPRSKEEMQQLKGIGPARLARYGPDILELVSGLASLRAGGVFGLPAGQEGRGVSGLEKEEEEVQKEEVQEEELQPAARETLPFTVAIEYRLSDAVRRRLVR